MIAKRWRCPCYFRITFLSFFLSLAGLSIVPFYLMLATTTPTFKFPYGTSPHEQQEPYQEQQQLRQQHHQQQKRQHAETEIQWYDSKYIGVSAQFIDYFSGTWIIPVLTYIDTVDTDMVGTLEDSVHVIWNGRSNRPNIRMSVDWFDLCVEHMSKWWKLIEISSIWINNVGIRRITDNFKAYIDGNIDTKGSTVYISEDADGSNNNVTSEWIWMKDPNDQRHVQQLDHDRLLHPTIAAIAFQPYEQVFSTNDIKRDRSIQLTVTSLGATITSLTRAGFGRILVVGAKDSDKSFFDQTVRMILLKDGNGTNIRTTTTTKVVPSPASTVLMDYDARDSRRSVPAIEDLVTEYAFIQVQNRSWLASKWMDPGAAHDGPPAITP
jgi:hypothetical protein